MTAGGFDGVERRGLMFVLSSPSGAGGGGSNTILPSIAGQFAKINGVLGQGTLTQNPSDPNLATLSWLVPQRTTTWFPTVRVDYNLTESLRFNASYSQTKSYNLHNYTPLWPGGIDTIDYTSSGGNNKIAGFGFDWTIRPTLVNQFHAGFTYQYSYFSPENKGMERTCWSSLARFRSCRRPRARTS
jgi:hypothetical protein